MHTYKLALLIFQYVYIPDSVASAHRSIAIPCLTGPARTRPNDVKSPCASFAHRSEAARLAGEQRAIDVESRKKAIGHNRKAKRRVKCLHFLILDPRPPGVT